MKFLSYKVFDGKTNMQIDEEILSSSINTLSEPVLRLYGWEKPTVTIGRNQSIDSVNQEYCKNNCIDVVRRPTGGRALLHDKEITYSFVCAASFLKSGQNIISSYKEISEALILGFKTLGIDLYYPEYKKVFPKNGYCMSVSTGSDLSFQDKKLIGSAQYRKNGYILQHGSIILDIDSEILKNLFNADASGLITLKEINPDLAQQPEIVCEAIKSGFEEKFQA